MISDSKDRIRRQGRAARRASGSKTSITAAIRAPLGFVDVSTHLVIFGLGFVHVSLRRGPSLERLRHVNQGVLSGPPGWILGMIFNRHVTPPCESRQQSRTRGA